MAEETETILPPSGRVAILGLGILPGIASATITPLLPAISDAFSNGSNGIWIKSVVTATGLGMLIGAPTGGVLADRFGRRPVLLSAVLLFGIFGCGIMLMSELWQIILARFVVGLASGAMAVSIFAVIGDHFRGARQSRWIGFNAGVASFVLLPLTPLVGKLSDLLGWRYGFSIYVIAVPVLIAIALGIPGRKGKVEAIKPTGPLLPPLAEIPWRAVLLAVFLGTLGMGTSLYWPFRLREVGVGTSLNIALFALPQALVTGVAMLSYVLFRRYASISQMFVGGALLSAGGLVVVGLAQTPSTIMVALAFEGLGIGMMTPNITNYALIVSPPAVRARAVGLVKGAMYGSPFLTQFALEPIAHAAGTAAALWTVAAVAALIALAVACGALRLPPNAGQAQRATV